jgi:hypothetical protein
VDPSKYGRKLDANNEPRFLEQVKYFIERAAHTTDVPDDYMEIITTCNTTIRLNLPLVRDDGTIENITAYRYVSFSFLITQGPALAPQTAR